MGLRRWDEARACCEAALDAGAGPRITLGLVLAYLGEPEVGEAHLRRALELAANGEETARAYLHLGRAAARCAAITRARWRRWSTASARRPRLGLRGSFGHFMYVNAADDLLRLGRWDEAAERLAEAERMDLSRTASALRRAIAGQLHALRGELEAARRELDAAGDDGLPSEFLTPLAAARAALALARGRRRRRRACTSTARSAASRTRSTRRRCTRSALRAEAEAAEQARARRRAPDPARAGALLAGLERAASTATPPPDALAHRALARAEHARVDGRSRAASCWAAAADAFDALAEPYPAAYARAARGRGACCWRAATARRAALRARGRARHGAVALGARPLREAVEALARRARLDLDARRRRPPPATTTASGLTDARGRGAAGCSPTG